MAEKRTQLSYGRVLTVSIVYDETGDTHTTVLHDDMMALNRIELALRLIDALKETVSDPTIIYPAANVPNAREVRALANVQEMLLRNRRNNPRAPRIKSTVEVRIGEAHIGAAVRLDTGEMREDPVSLALRQRFPGFEFSALEDPQSDDDPHTLIYLPGDPDSAEDFRITQYAWDWLQRWQAGENVLPFTMPLSLVIP